MTGPSAHKQGFMVVCLCRVLLQRRAGGQIELCEVERVHLFEATMVAGEREHLPIFTGCLLEGTRF